MGATKLHTPSLQTLDLLEVDALVISLTTDDRPLSGLAGFLDWRLCGEISQFLLNEQFTGALGEKIMSITGGRIPAQRLFYVGWGAQKDIEKNAATCLPLMTTILLEAKVESCAIHLPEPVTPILERAEAELSKSLGPRLRGIFRSEGPSASH